MPRGGLRRRFPRISAARRQRDALGTIPREQAGGILAWRVALRVGKLFTRYKVTNFHTIDVRRTKAGFKGWKIDRKIEFLDEFQHVINETLLGGVAAFIGREDYAYYCGLTWPKGTRKDFGIWDPVPCVPVADHRHRRSPRSREQA